MVLTAPINGASGWVAFAENNGDDAFETVIASSPGKPKLPRRSASSSSRGRPPSDSSSVASWMMKPVVADSIAPVVPPKASVPSTEHPVANKRRPPRSRTNTSNTDSSSAHRRTNPVSSEDSSTSSVDKPSRGRGSERKSSSAIARSSSRPKESSSIRSSSRDSRRGRSRSRVRPTDVHEGEVVQMGSAHSRGRSSSRTRSNPIGERSGSFHQKTTISSTSGAKPSSGRPSSRPPATSSTRRTRSSSRNPSTRSRSSSRTRSNNHKPPPSTSRTRREMRVCVSSSHSVGPGLPDARRSSSTARSVASDIITQDDNIGRDISFGRTRLSVSTGNNSVRSRPALMEKLFGDQVTDEAKQSFMAPSPTAGSVSSFSWHQAENIHPRILLTATVYHNTATNLWIATINTNQKGVAKNPATASKYLKAFSFASEKEARESAIANAPPKMLSFGENPSCHICKGKFAMFRRASHCRNCGVCVCTNCSTMWPAKMIPETYNLKKEASVRVCKCCTHLSAAFKKALLDGDYEEAVAVYGSGNINLRTPFPQFSKKKEETMYPIHCAVAGGNLDILRWLVEDHFCPIKVIRSGSSKKPKRGGSADQLILTSKNRSVLTIAMECLSVDILRYLVVDNGVSIYDSKDLKSSLRAMEAVLLALPGSRGRRRPESSDPRWDDRSYDGNSYTSSFDADADQTVGEDTHASSMKKNADSCIICYENSIDCVMTPCGHQVCCLECSKNMKVCPVCNVRGEFIKIFRP